MNFPAVFSEMVTTDREAACTYLLSLAEAATVLRCAADDHAGGGREPSAVLTALGCLSVLGCGPQEIEVAVSAVARLSAAVAGTVARGRPW